MNNAITTIFSHSAVEIEHPSEDAVVPHKLVVGGRVWGEGCVQVLVWSADNRYYTQQPVIRMGDDKWVCVVVLGFAQFTHADYLVYAGVGGKRILAARVDDLPKDVLWTAARLVRHG